MGAAQHKKPQILQHSYLCQREPQPQHLIFKRKVYVIYSHWLHFLFYVPEAFNSVAGAGIYLITKCTGWYGRWCGIVKKNYLAFGRNTKQ